MSKAGWSQKAWLLGSHCHDSEGTSEAQRGESLIIAEIHFSFSLKMSCFFSIQMTRSLVQQENSVEKHRQEALFCLPIETQRFSDAPRCGWGNEGRSPYTLIMRRCLDVITMGGKQVLHLTVSDAWLSVLTDRAWKEKNHWNLIALVSRAMGAAAGCGSQVNSGLWGSPLVLWTMMVLKDSEAPDWEIKCC